VYKIFLFFLIFATITLNGQDKIQTFKFGENQIFKKGDSYIYKFDPGPEISDEQRILIKEIIDKNKSVLREKNILPDKNVENDILFQFPLKIKDGLNDPGFYSISAYLDHNSDYPNQLQDYMCGELTYDLENGYNHEGTDFFLWPFPWFKMDNDEVQAIAAASGIITFKQDGHFDRNCNGEDMPWNAIFIQHSNGYSTWYGHLKNGSLTDKEIGQEVEGGEYLGIVGGSGISFTPHLHFEVHNELDDIIDPYEGPCNSELNSSLWEEQKSYIDAGINKISTNSKLPFFPECPLQETMNESDSFTINDTVFLLAYFRNISSNDSMKISIYRPDDSVWYEWWWNNEMPFYNASWNYWYIIINDEPEGYWKYKLRYKEETFEQEFHYSNSSSILESNINILSIFPNPVTKNAQISLPSEFSEAFTFEIKNILGQNPTINYKFNTGKKSIVLDCSGLKKGIYLISMENNKSIYQGKLIKK